MKTGILFTSNYHHLPWKKMWHLILKIQNSFHLAMICAKFCWNTQVPGKIMSQNVNSLKKFRKTLDNRNQKSFTEPSFTWPNNTENGVMAGKDAISCMYNVFLKQNIEKILYLHVFKMQSFEIWVYCDGCTYGSSDDHRGFEQVSCQWLSSPNHLKRITRYCRREIT